jgi:hypothetical protein
VASATLRTQKARQDIEDLKRQLARSVANFQKENSLLVATLKRQLDDLNEDDRTMNEEFHQRTEAFAKRRRTLAVSLEHAEAQISNNVTP